MEKYLLVVRFQLLMGRPVSDNDRKILDCYYVTPVFSADHNWENIEIVEAGYELFCAGRPEFRHTESAELVHIA